MDQFDNKQLVTFKSIDNQVEFNVLLDNDSEMVWVSVPQMEELFGKARRTIGEHIKNIYSEGELEESSTRRNFRQVQLEGIRQVPRNVAIYNLDVVISVGYA